jgi:hypothetical protein
VLALDGLDIERRRAAPRRGDGAVWSTSDSDLAIMD